MKKSQGYDSVLPNYQSYLKSQKEMHSDTAVLFSQ